MRFGEVPVAQAEGAVLAHAAKLPTGRIPKGTRLSRSDVSRLSQAGLSTVVAALVEPHDLLENEAADRLGRRLASEAVEAGEASTGRVNLFARSAGLVLVDRGQVDAVNAVDPGVTLATLAEFAPVVAGQMVATVKIIPLAVPAEVIETATGILAARPALRLARFRPHRVALVQTRLPGLKASVLDKTRRVLDERLKPSNSCLVHESRCEHDTAALAEALDALPPADLVVLFGASAVIDALDVLPSAIRRVGGAVLHIGMPVDPGNLLLLGRFRDRPILGAPGCARSPKENGFDWIVNRLLADLAVTSEDIRGLGVGGLLTEIASRPQPRLT